MAAVSRKAKSLQAVVSEASGDELKIYLRQFAADLTSEVADAAPERSGEILSALIAELALAAADQRRRAERRERQRECVTAAKARGVRFGRKKKPLPDNFDECCQAWMNGELSVRAAAESCGMVAATFHKEALLRKEAGAARTAL